MIVRYLEYLTALSTERHFARAAARCLVTQPTLSAGIKQLEESLGVLIVERRQRFVRFTAEGERVLAWAQRVLLDYRGLEQELSELRDGLAGQMKIGAIPVSLPIIALLTGPLLEQHPRSSVQVISHTSLDIQRGLDDFTIDAGVSYLDNEPLSRVRSKPLYRERYVLITRADSAIALQKTVSWAQAASLPLCLLTPSMQNRRIIDTHFREAGATIRPRAETNSLITLWSHVRLGPWSTVVPHTFLSLLRPDEGVVALPLAEPDASHLLGLVASDRDPLPPLTRALLAVADRVELGACIDARIAQSWPIITG